MLLPAADGLELAGTHKAHTVQTTGRDVNRLGKEEYSMIHAGSDTAYILVTLR